MLRFPGILNLYQHPSITMRKSKPHATANENVVLGPCGLLGDPQQLVNNQVSEAGLLSEYSMLDLDEVMLPNAIHTSALRLQLERPLKFSRKDPVLSRSQLLSLYCYACP